MAKMERKLADNIFQLSRYKKDCYYQPISVDFNPVQRMNSTPSSVLPTYNNDGKFYTPSFFSPYESRSSFKHKPDSSNDKEDFAHKHKVVFDRKIARAMSNPSNESVGLVSDGTTYCSVCMGKFFNYWKHIGSQAHKRKIKKSRANSYINDLCSDLAEENEQSKDNYRRGQAGKIQKRKQIKKAKKLKKQSVQNEDLIIKWPREFFDKEKSTFNFGASNLHPLNSL